MKKTLWILGIVAALVVVDAFSNRYFSRALSSDFEVSYLKFDKGWVYFQVKNTGKMIYTGGYAKIVDLETGASLYGGNFPDGFHSDRFLSKPDSPSFDKALLKSRETAYKRYKIMDAGLAPPRRCRAIITLTPEDFPQYPERVVKKFIDFEIP